MKLRAMPRRLWVGLSLLLLVAAVCLRDVISFGPRLLNVCWFGMTAGLVLALPCGRPLARQMGRFVAGIHIGLGGVLLLLFAGDDRTLILILVGALLLWSLSGEAVRRYFGLLCPDCGSRRTRARGLFYSGVRCRDCGREWGAP